MQIRLYSDQTESKVFVNPLEPAQSGHAYMYVLSDTVDCEVILRSQEKDETDWNNKIIYSDGKYCQPRAKGSEPNRLDIKPNHKYCISADKPGVIVYFAETRLHVDVGKRTTTEQELANAIAKALDAAHRGSEKTKQLSAQVEGNAGRIKDLEINQKED